MSFDYPAEILRKASQIKLLICDVDGVLSDGKVYFGESGQEIKNFNIKDGLGLKLLQRAGIQVAIITGRSSDIVARRAGELGIVHVYQGKSDKRATYQELKRTLQLEPQQIAHIGDDLPDLALMRTSGLGIAVADAHPFVRRHADWVTGLNGGAGAVRETADLILHAQNKLDAILSTYL